MKLNLNLTIIYRITVLVILGYIAVQLYILKKEMHDNLKEIDMVISKLDYVESDINSSRQ